MCQKSIKDALKLSNTLNHWHYPQIGTVIFVNNHRHHSLVKTKSKCFPVHRRDSNIFFGKTLKKVVSKKFVTSELKKIQKKLCQVSIISIGVKYDHNES